MLTPRVATHLQVCKLHLLDKTGITRAQRLSRRARRVVSLALGSIVQYGRVRCFGDGAPQSLVEFFTDNQPGVI
jgi:hypothetical protein